MQPQTPTILVIFGATGDLGKKKLMPALWSLYQKGSLPKKFHIVGVARTKRSNKIFQSFIRGAIKGGKKDKEAFTKHASYHAGLFDEKETYEGLKEKLDEIDKKFGTCTNKLFYLSVSPDFYEPLLTHLAESELTAPCGGKDGWTRVLVEKPFGRDDKTAAHLDTLLGDLFQEEQIFRIDHYIAKEAVQNLLAFRFSNDLFESIWDRDHIERVEIKLLEDFGIGNRGSFYDSYGAIRDVGQNHLLQMLAFVAMESPEKLDAEMIRERRTDVLESLRRIPKRSMKKKVERGQYKGYRNERGVKKNSGTETYFKIEAEINNKRWKGVPFILESGKKLGETVTEIAVYFKEVESCVCPTDMEHHHKNAVFFRMKPKEEIAIRFWTKTPGLTFQLQEKTLSFSYEDLSELSDAYEKVLFDCIEGDQTLFTSTEEVIAAWRFITPILHNIKEVPLKKYDKR